jgi:hypothetical protein
MVRLLMVKAMRTMRTTYVNSRRHCRQDPCTNLSLIDTHTHTHTHKRISLTDLYSNKAHNRQSNGTTNHLLALFVELLGIGWHLIFFTSSALRRKQEIECTSRCRTHQDLTQFIGFAHSIQVQHGKQRMASNHDAEIKRIDRRDHW